MTALARGFRQLLRAPGFAVPIVAGLALAIGASTAVFSAFSAMLIRSLGIADPGSVVALWRTDEAHGQKSVELAYRDFVEWNKATDVVDGVALASSVNLDLSVLVGDTPEQVDSTTVTGNYFRVLGAKPFAGRLLNDDDDRPGAPLRAVLSYRVWRTRFGADFGVVGRELRSPGGVMTIVGVASPDFDFPRDVAIWLPLHAAWPDVEKSAELQVFRGVARLAEGASPVRAQARLDAIARPQAVAAGSSGRWPAVQATPIVDEIYGSARPALWALLGAVLLVLLIACANAANLLLNRAAERGHELAVRAALGAGRNRLVRLLLGESAVLAAVSGTLGLALAALGIRVIAALAPEDVPRIGDASLDPVVLGFDLAVTAATIFIFGLGPAILASRRDPGEELKGGGRGLSGTAVRKRLRWLLIALEGGFSAVLLVGAGALVHSFHNLAAVNPGFRPDRILTFRVTLEKPDQESRRAFYSEALARLRGLPGVESAAAVLLRPLSGAVGWDTTYRVEGQPAARTNPNPNGNYEAISPDYFRTMGMRMLAGRDFAATDTANAPGVVIIDELTARRHWAPGEAVGKRIRLSANPRDPWLTIVGVVAPVRYRDWQAPWPDFYVPVAQRAQHRTDFVVKTAGDPWKLAEAVRREILATDKTQPVSNLTTMDALVDRALSRSRFNGVIASCLAACALMLAAVGIYGVLSYAVTQRRAEIAMRIALGATPRCVAGLVSREAMTALSAGSAAGVVGGVWLERILSTLLFGIGGVDVASITFAVAALTATAAAACLAPSLKAAATDPAASLRC